MHISIYESAIAANSGGRLWHNKNPLLHAKIFDAREKFLLLFGPWTMLPIVGRAGTTLFHCASDVDDGATMAES